MSSKCHREARYGLRTGLTHTWGPCWSPGRDCSHVGSLELSALLQELCESDDTEFGLQAVEYKLDGGGSCMDLWWVNPSPPKSRIQILPTTKITTVSTDPLSLTLIQTRSFMKLNGTGGLSASCLSKTLKLMESFKMRGGVPVFSLPMVKPRRSSVCERPTAGSSPQRPAGIWSRPIRTMPRRKVPFVNTTLLASILLPSARRTNTCAEGHQRSL